MMSAADHQAIRELLPDYAIGALPDPVLDAVGEHIASCAECEAALDGLLELGAFLDLAAGPDPAVRDRLLATVAAMSGPPLRPAVLTALPPTPLPITPPARARGVDPIRVPAAATATMPAPAALRQPRPVARWLAAVAAVLVIGLGWWNLQLQRELEALGPADIILNAAAMVSLDESQLSPRPAGTLFVSAAGDEAVLTAAGLPPVAAGESYQVWLFDDTGSRIRLTEFTPDAAGSAHVTLSLPQPLLAFSAIAVSAGVSGEPAPSGPLALGAWFTPPAP